MGTEAGWVPYVVAAIGAAIGHQQQQKVLKRQDELAARGIRQQAKKGEEAAQQVEQQVRRIEASTPDTQTAMQQFAEQLQRTAPQQTAGFSDQYGTAYEEAAGAAKKDVGEYGAKFANLMARLDAPSRQREAEGFQFGRLGTGLRNLESEAQAADFLNRLRLSSVRANPYAIAASQIASGYAQSEMGKP